MYGAGAVTPERLSSVGKTLTGIKIHVIWQPDLGIKAYIILRRDLDACHVGPFRWHIAFFWKLEAKGVCLSCGNLYGGRGRHVC